MVEKAFTLDALERLLESAELVVDRAELVRAAIESARAGPDFADALIDELGRRAGCVETVTLDRRAARLAGMRLLE